jgi:hypothetical protein
MSKPAKIVLLALGALIVVFALALLLLDPWVENKIKDSIAQNIKSPNRLEYGGLEASFFAGKLVVKDISATYFLGKWKRRANVEIQELNIQGIDWLALVFSKKLEIRALHIDKPTFSIAFEEKKDSTAVGHTSGNNAPPLKYVNIGQLSIRHGQFSFLRKNKQAPPDMQADTFNLEVGEFSLLMEKDGQPMEVLRAELDLRNFVRRDEDGLHNISFRQAHFSKKDSLLELRGLKVSPNFSKKEFHQHLKYKKSRLDLDFPSVRLHGWQFGQLIKGNIVARTALFDRLKIGVYSNRNLPIDPQQYKKFPQEALLTTPLGITLDTIRVKDAALLYENLGEDPNTPGSLSASNMQALFTNVTNDTARIRRQPVLEISLEALLWEKHHVTQHIWMNLGSPNYDFTYTGNVANVPFTALNAFLAPTHQVAFERGTIQRLDYRINADKRRATGQLTLEYDDLEFALLDENKEKKKLLSRIVDLLFVPDENDRADDDFQKGAVYALRDTRRSFYHFWWKAIQSGIQSSILSDKAAERIQKNTSKKKKR